MLAGGDARLHVFALHHLAPELERVERELCLLAPQETGAALTPAGGLTGDRRLARIALRLMLASSGAVPAIGTPLVEGLGGKPTLPCCRIAFNVSHCDGVALIGTVSDGGPIGVDIERPRALGFSAARCDQIVAAARGLCAGPTVGLGTQEPVFGAVAAWTVLEAQAKAEGCGIGALLMVLGIMGAGGRSRSAAEVGAVARRHRIAKGLVTFGLDLGPALIGAVSTSAGALDFPPVPPAAVTIGDISTLAATARAQFQLTAPPDLRK